MDGRSHEEREQPIALQRLLALGNTESTQQAVILNIVVIGEAATKLADEYPEFVARYPEVQWKSMRGMRNRMAHGYFDINLDIVWDTIRQSIPALTQQIQKIRQNQS